MDPISNVDRLVLLLRQRLAEQAKAAAGRRDTVRLEPGAAGLGAVQALAGLDDIDPRQLKRALIQNLLADSFGGALINDAKFQQIVDRVADTLQGEPASARLLDRVIEDLRASAR
jgi:hypothetical protein